MERNDLEGCRNLLELLRTETPSRARRLTILELGGYPHLENVASNILKFFLSSDEEHGFDRIVLDSLVSLVPDMGEGFEVESINEVTREQATLQNKRIDLVVESHTAVVGIENKIGQPVDNDLRSYMDFLKEMGSEKKVIGILLTLQDTDPNVPLEGFHCVTWDSFFQAVFERVPSQLPSIDTQYLTDFVVFAKTIVALKGGNQMVKDEEIKLACDYESQFRKLFGIGKSLRRDMKEKAEELKRLIQTETDLSDTACGTEAREDELRCVFWIRFRNKIPGLRILGIEAALYPCGWRFEFWPEPAAPVFLEQWLRKHEIPAENHPDPKRNTSRVSKEYRLDYKSNIESVAGKFRELMKRAGLPFER